jgi:hypothetical protein
MKNNSKRHRRRAPVPRAIAEVLTRISLVYFLPAAFVRCKERKKVHQETNARGGNTHKKIIALFLLLRNFRGEPPTFLLRAR